MANLPRELLPEAVKAASLRLDGSIVRTPTIEWDPGEAEALFGTGTRVFVKYEAMQRTGSFKVRGTLNLIGGLSDTDKAKGVVAVSAGNHAIAVAYAARAFGVSAKIAMPASASPYRREKAESLGAEIILSDDVGAAFEACEAIKADEGRIFVHPFNDLRMMQGSATAGLEMAEDLSRDGVVIDQMLLSIGGGGFAAGFASSIYHAFPTCDIIGVEPTLANVMHRAFAAGEVVKAPLPTSMADSLGSPLAAEPSHSICRSLLSKVVLVSEGQIAAAMRLTQSSLKMAVEPAGAATLAALMGPMREYVEGKTVGVVLCGANIGVDEYCRIIQSKLE